MIAHEPVTEADLSRTGPRTLAGRYLRRFWTPVAVLDDIAPGRAKPVQILGERFTVYRGENGDPHVVAPECAHRGTQLSTGWVEGDGIRCFYHGWKYDAHGTCIEQPAEHESFASKVRIAAYPTCAYLGLVFAYLGAEQGDGSDAAIGGTARKNTAAPPPFPRLKSFERPGYIEARAHPRHCNFYNQLENSVDQVHFNFVHRRSPFADQGLNRDIPTVTGTETEYGLFKDHRYRDGKRRIGHILMPTTLYSRVIEPGLDWADHLSWRIPVDDDRHISFTVDLVEKSGADLERHLAVRKEQAEQLRTFPAAGELVAAILRGDLHVDDVPADHPQLVGIQDDVALAAQPAMHVRAPDRLGRSDAQLIQLRTIWLRELRALAAGEPLKNWTWPEDISVTSGV